MHNDKLLYVLNEIKDFVSKESRQKMMLLFVVWELFFQDRKVKLEDLTLSIKMKSRMKFTINNSYFSISSKIFCQVISIPMGLDPSNTGVKYFTHWDYFSGPSSVNKEGSNLNTLIW